MNELVLDNMRLVSFIYSRLFPSEQVRHNREDLISEGYLGLLEAAKKHDPLKGKFSTFACLVIRQKMIAFLKRKCNDILISLDAPLPGLDADEGLTLGDTLASKADTESEAESEISICTERLGSIQKTILTLLLDEKKPKEIGAAMRLPVKVVDQNIALIKANLIREGLYV